MCVCYVCTFLSPRARYFHRRYTLLRAIQHHSSKHKCIRFSAYPVVCCVRMHSPGLRPRPRYSIVVQSLRNTPQERQTRMKCVRFSFLFLLYFLVKNYYFFCFKSSLARLHNVHGRSQCNKNNTTNEGKKKTATAHKTNVNIHKQ